MRCLTASECAERARQVGIRFGKAGIEYRKPARHFVQLAYKSRLVNAAEVALVLVECLGSYDWAVVWAYDLIWSDHSAEPNPPPDWRDCARLRGRIGEAGRLHEAPGHEFSEGSRADCARVIQAAMDLGWDARAFGSPWRCTIDLSHDDIISLRAQDSLAATGRLLTGLGLRSIVTANRGRL